MPARVTDPELLAAIREQSQKMELLTSTVLNLDKRQKTLETSISQTMGALERGWNGAAETLANRDAALSQFEAQIQQQLASLTQASSSTTIADLQASLDRVFNLVEQATTSHNSALNTQKEAFYRLRKALVEQGLADEETAYAVTMHEREAAG